MEIEKILLRDNPKIEITINENEFVIFNEEKQLRKVFFYEKINSIELIEKKTNWFVTFLSFLVGFLFESLPGSLYKDGKKLIINHENDKTEISLNNCDTETTRLFVNKINLKIDTK